MLLARKPQDFVENLRFSVCLFPLVGIPILKLALSHALKDCLPYLFHGFRNKYFNKISLDNMLYFQNKLYRF